MVGGGPTIRGLVINRFSASRHFPGSGGGNTIQGNYIGTDVSGGTMDLGNRARGFSCGSQTISSEARPRQRGTSSLETISTAFTSRMASPANVIIGNYIGTDVTGHHALGNTYSGVDAWTDHNRIGTDGDGVDDVFEANLISGNGSSGISLTDEYANDNIVAGNLIGTDVSGTISIENGWIGISVGRGSRNRIGTDNSPDLFNDTERNVISGNRVGGIGIFGDEQGPGSDNIIAGNFIGTDITGSRQLTDAEGHPVFGNGDQSGVGIWIAASYNRIGAGSQTDSQVERNVIAYNAGAGVVIGVTALDPDWEVIGNSIRGNAIFASYGLGIDLQGDGVTRNDPGDIDAGENNLQNYPLLASAMAGEMTAILGSLDSTPETVFLVDVYASPDVDPTGYGEGKEFLGTITAITDSAGHAEFSAILPTPSSANAAITVTATDPEGSTSEFGPAILARVGCVSTASEDDGVYSLSLLTGANDAVVSSLSVSDLVLIDGDDAGITPDGNHLVVNPAAYDDLAAGELAVIHYGYDVVDGHGRPRVPDSYDHCCRHERRSSTLRRAGSCYDP